MPKISVIVPIYKVEPYLRRCVDSILAQTFTDFELVLIDDGSPDSCGEICEEYSAHDERITVIHRPNGGLSAARNSGIDWAFANSDSEWLNFIDSDDWVHPQYLEALYQAVVDTGTKISIGKMLETSKNSIAWHEIAIAGKKSNTEDFYCTASWDDEHSGVWTAVSAWGKLYQKELFESVRFPVGKLFEDAFTIHKVLFSCNQISAVDAVLYAYYINPDSITRSIWTPKKLQELEARESQTVYFRSHGYNAALQKSVLPYVAVVTRQLEELNSCDEKTIKVYSKCLRRQLGKFIRRNKDCIAFHENEKKYIYEIAYPHFMYCYWLYKGVLGKIKRILKCQP